jgi:peptidoglycan/LPS O-acetylase OafA/YrhL
MTKNTSLGYVPALDGLRGIAVILVMLTHANFQLADNGILGVDIFFALSGFLITTLLLEEYSLTNSVSLPAFYVRRSFRLFPALYILLLVIVLYKEFLPDSFGNGSVRLEVLSSALYLNNISWAWGWKSDVGLLGHSWSLAVEEQFYLLWPVILIFFLRSDKLNVLIYLLLFLIPGIMYLKYAGLVSDIANSLLHESIFIGCFAAMIRNKINFRIPYADLITIGLLLFILVIGIAPIRLYMSIYESGLRSLFAIVSVIIIFGLINGESHYSNKFLSIPILRFTGKISYALYLWHVPVFKWFKWHSTLEDYQSFILKFAITIIIACLSWIAIEKRLLRHGHALSKLITPVPGTS